MTTATDTNTDVLLSPNAGLVLSMVREHFGPRLALTPDEVAQVLPLSRSTVWQMVKDGRLPTVPNAPKQMVPLAGLLEWLENGQQVKREARVTAYGLRKRGTWRMAS